MAAMGIVVYAGVAKNVLSTRIFDHRQADAPHLMQRWFARDLVAENKWMPGAISCCTKRCSATFCARAFAS
jgi:hypothetical protein